MDFSKNFLSILFTALTFFAPVTHSMGQKKQATKQGLREVNYPPTIFASVYSKEQSKIFKNQQWIILNWSIWHTYRSKDIRAIKGYFTIFDLFDEKIATFRVIVEEPIAFGWGNGRMGTYYVEFDPYSQSPENIKLQEADRKKLENLKIVWKTEKVLFSDGSTSE